MESGRTFTGTDNMQHLIILRIKEVFIMGRDGWKR